jgi:hypothetical protein
MGMERVGLVGLAWVCACGPTTVVADGSGSDGGSSGETSGGSASITTSTSGPSTSVSEATGTTIGSSSVDSSSSTGACPSDDEYGGGDFDVGPPPPECSIFTQDCDEGMKCVPDWFATRVCEPIAVDPIADGQSCEAGGDDPCGPSSWCGLENDDGIGTCVPLCQGAADDPVCPDGMICVIDDEDIVAYCMAPCDPFDADACPGRTSCQATPRGFGCIENGGVDRDDACLQDDSCGAGLVCRSFDGCCHGKCCTPFCSDDNPCDAGTCTPIDDVPGVGYCG